MQELRREFMTHVESHQQTESNFQAFVRTCKRLGVNPEDDGYLLARHKVSMAMQAAVPEF